MLSVIKTLNGCGGNNPADECLNMIPLFLPEIGVIPTENYSYNPTTGVVSTQTMPINSLVVSSQLIEKVLTTSTKINITLDTPYVHDSNQFVELYVYITNEPYAINSNINPTSRTYPTAFGRIDLDISTPESTATITITKYAVNDSTEEDATDELLAQFNSGVSISCVYGFPSAAFDGPPYITTIKKFEIC